jgi:hypothetical protein
LRGVGRRQVWGMPRKEHTGWREQPMCMNLHGKRFRAPDCCKAWVIITCRR